VPAEQSPDPGSGLFFLGGVDVIENGLPSLPDVITYEMTIPISYWTAPKTAVVVFLRFHEHPAHGGIQPVVMKIPYQRETGKWIARTSGTYSASGFFFDPVTEPGFVGDLDGRPFVYGSLSTIQAEGNTRPRRHPQPGHRRGPQDRLRQHRPRPPPLRARRPAHPRPLRIRRTRMPLRTARRYLR
jgi:hypothetical protein